MDAKEIERLVSEKGTNQTIVIIFLMAVVVIAGIFLKEYMKDKEERRKEAEEKRKLDLERNENYVELIAKITTTMNKNSYSFDEFGKKIEEHQNYSTNKLDNLTDNIQDIKQDLNSVTEIRDKMATKEGLEEVKGKVEDLIKALE